MMQPQIPENENERIEALRNTRILDTPIQESFERITRLAQVLFQVPIVAFSLVDKDRQWFKSIQGLNVCETSRAVSFCGHTINQDDIFMVSDALQDARFADNPLVTQEPNIRFYAGCPVRTVDNYKIGTLCIIDVKSRSFTPEQLLQLRDLAGLIENELEVNKVYLEKQQLLEELSHLKKAAMTDGLTRLYNRAGIENLLASKINHAINRQTSFGVALIDVDNFKKVNDKHGHGVGDEVLRQVARRLLRGYRCSDTIGRWGGEEFLVIIDFAKPKDILAAAERARNLISAEPIEFDNKQLSITVTTGISIFDPKQPVDIKELVSQADKALYKGKHRGRNIVIQDDSVYAFENMRIPSKS